MAKTIIAVIFMVLVFVSMVILVPLMLLRCIDIIAPNIGVQYNFQTWLSTIIIIIFFLASIAAMRSKGTEDESD